MASVQQEDGNNISLNIMPMLDIFSILILFLLMNFSADPISHELNKAIELPESASMASLDEVPTVVISQDEILVNGKKILNLVNRDVQERDQSQGAITKLYQELAKLSEANKRFSKDKKNTGAITIEADKDHPYRLLKRVMLSAQQADFITFKFMVAKLQS